jgi:hypothetical protein
MEMESPQHRRNGQPPVASKTGQPERQCYKRRMSLDALRLGLLLSVLSACVPRAAPQLGAQALEATRTNIGRVLDGFHAAAARADETAYFDAFARDGTFLGTDATERWGVAAFRAYSHPHFAAGHGWTYVPRARHIAIHDSGASAWFDELLDHDRYGELRGSGVLVLEDGAWKVAQYNLTFTIPNARAKEVVELLNQHEPAPEP